MNYINELSQINKQLEKIVLKIEDTKLTSLESAKISDYCKYIKKTILEIEGVI